MSSSDREADLKVMREAILLARSARPSPNPPVGAVVLDKEGQVLANSFNAEAGG